MNLSQANHTLTPDNLFFYHGAAVLFTSSILVTLPANIYIMWLIGCGPGGPTATELFVLSLASSEVLFCILAFYLLLQFILEGSTEVWFQVLELTLQLMLVSPVIFQSCICLERYMAVVHPVVFLRFKPLRYRLACCVVIWLLMLFYSIIPAFTISVRASVYLLTSMSMFLMVLMVYCSVHILCVLSQPGPGDGDRDKGVRRKAFKVIMTSMLFTVCTQAFRVFTVGPIVLFASQHVIDVAVLISLAISIVTGTATPVLYLYRAGKLPWIQV
ncbi:P2Y purinoceptor 8-like [Antennarius striatus]|uniref:P2Y purinoceptor 8-like n=1 Tax=Antennarius striatus TaxID=241820 RepID=UPI0035B490BD